MAESKQGLRRPRPGPRWSVQCAFQRDHWCDERAPCATCGSTVDLRETHHQLELVRHRDPDGRKRSIDRERFVFCDQSCVDRWLTVDE